MGVFYFTTIYLFQKFSAPFWHHSHLFSLFPYVKKAPKENLGSLDFIAFINNQL